MEQTEATHPLSLSQTSLRVNQRLECAVLELQAQLNASATPCLATRRQPPMTNGGFVAPSESTSTSGLTSSTTSTASNDHSPSRGLLHQHPARPSVLQTPPPVGAAATAAASRGVRPLSANQSPLRLFSPEQSGIAQLRSSSSPAATPTTTITQETAGGFS